MNDACDAEEDSYDLMVLLTGRGDEMADVGKGRGSGSFQLILLFCTKKISQWDLHI